MAPYGLLIDEGCGHVGAADVAAALVEAKLAKEVIRALGSVREVVGGPELEEVVARHLWRLGLGLGLGLGFGLGLGLG